MNLVDIPRVFVEMLIEGREFLKQWRNDVRVFVEKRKTQLLNSATDANNINMDKLQKTNLGKKKKKVKRDKSKTKEKTEDV